MGSLLRRREGGVAGCGLLPKLDGDEPWEGEHGRGERSVAAALAVLDRAPLTADGGEADMVGDRKALQDLFCEMIW